MNIIGFGDSFIQNNPYIEDQYSKYVAAHLSARFNCVGVPGSGIWDAFFEFKNRKSEAKAGITDDFDVAIFVWSESSRFYHPDIRNITYSSVLSNLDSKNPIWTAAKYYYEHLHNPIKVNHEITAFFYWFDNWLYENYPDMKVIHMTGFPKHDERMGADYYKIVKYYPEKLEYFHDWKHSVEIRPPLLHFSLNDEWPDDLGNEHRLQHLTKHMHYIVSELIMDAIRNYVPGRVVNYDYIRPPMEEKTIFNTLKKLL